MGFVFSLVLGIVAFLVALWIGRMLRRQRSDVGAVTMIGVRTVFAIAAVVLLLVAILNCITIIPAGHVGVVDFFGRVSERALPAGIQLRNPLARIIKLSVQTQEIKEEMEVPSKEGLTVGLEASVLFHLDPQKAPEVYRDVGVHYVGVLLEPQFRSVSRGVTATYEAKALYTSEREALALLLAEDLVKLLAPRGITIESAPLRKITLPPGLSQSIEEKLRAEQDSQRMQFVLLKEKQEAERKRIEASGIADFQRIVSEGISEPLLRWKGIEATLEIAKSANAKVVIVGGGKDGLPVILDTK